MDFDNVLSIASQNQGLSSLPKRYSLKPGPPKKDPKVKGVNSAAVQAFLKKQEVEQKKKDLVKKREKDDLLAKRVELKSDRKARAMASRTKDNFRGYNGIPVVDQPKKKQSKTGCLEEQQDVSDAYDEDNYEYADSDSECEPEPVPVRPQARIDGPSRIGSTQKKNHAPAKAALPRMNFADLLKLAEKKQFEPVELKPVKKNEERLRTAEEIKELEFERKVKKQDKGKESKADKSSGLKDSKPSSNSHKKSLADRDNREGKSHKSSVEKPPSGISKMPKPHTQSERPHGSAKSSHGNGSKPSSSFSRALSGKPTMRGGAVVSVKHAPPRPPSGQKPSTSSDLTSKRGYPGLPQEKASSSGSRPVAASNPSRLPNQGQGIKGSGQIRPSQGNLSKGPPQRLGKGDMSRSGCSAPPSRPGSSGPMRATPGGLVKQAGIQQPRPGGGLQGRPVPPGARPSENGPSRPGGGLPARPLNSMGPGPGRPQCTVVSETISSKNFAPKSGMAPRPLVPQGPRTMIGPTGHRVLVTSPGPILPPITSSYKRSYDDEEYDPDMDDFIDDEGEEQDEISKHIREIFGYDRTKYKDESDYALKFMESSWKDQQKEEARSLRLAVLEDEEEERRELEEMQRKPAKRTKLS
ncbi:protein SPT2 homolog isoform X2 [Brachyhypopomus gauderio]|uniref:protein SPT2 homolog isoform X2 n=1 Tax=Brachyhypopomus gauderio TaxID=698409 RepID=UPI0040431218